MKMVRVTAYVPHMHLYDVIAVLQQKKIEHVDFKIMEEASVQPPQLQHQPRNGSQTTFLRELARQSPEGIDIMVVKDAWNKAGHHPQSFYATVSRAKRMKYITRKGHKLHAVEGK